MGGFSQQSVSDNGGVAWAKQVAQSMDPGAIDSQIQSYKAAASSLASVQTTLQNVKNNLAASWSGDAADQAQQSFQQSIAHSQKVQDTITQAIIPPLQNAKDAQTQFINSMSKVPDEQPVPSNSFLDDVGSVFGVETPAQKAQAHNIAARNQTAEALNTLSNSYESSASKLSAAGGSEGTVTTTGPGTGAYNLGSVASSSGDGAASSYGQSVSSRSYSPGSSYVPTPSGTTNPGRSPKTTLSGTSAPTVTDPTWSPTTNNPTSASPSPFEPSPIWEPTGPFGGENGGKYSGGLITDEPESLGGGPGGDGGYGDESLNEGKLRTSSGVFDETGLGDGELTGGSGSGPRGGMSNTDSNELGGAEERAGGSGGAANGEGSESEAGGGMGRRGGMGGASEEELGSSKYTRGRYLGEMEEEDGRKLSSVRSVFEDATDAEGNKVNMMGSGRRGTAVEDEEDERGKRPSYLKEDEFWNNAQRIVPPVIQ